MLAAMTNNAAERSDFKMSRQRPYFILVTFEECAIRITPPLTFQTMNT
jgi:hypothetical protein